MTMFRVDERGNWDTHTSGMGMQVESNFVGSNLALYIKSFKMFIHFAVLVLVMYPKEIA